MKYLLYRFLIVIRHLAFKEVNIILSILNEENNGEILKNVMGITLFFSEIANISTAGKIMEISE